MRHVPGVILALLVAAPAVAAAQVESGTRLDAKGYGVTRVHNASPSIVDVAVELRRPGPADSALALGAAVQSMISPSRFHLAPGETQTVRILARETVEPGSELRLVTTLTPRAATQVEPTRGTGAQLVLVTRLISTVHVQ